MINQNVSPTEKIEDESIFIWLDILGFSDALDDGLRYRELHRLLNVFQATFVHESYDLMSIADGIILTINNRNSDELIDIFRTIGEKQFQFILQEKHFVRGGIAIGSHLSRSDNNNFLIGNGLSRAVKLESSCINHPVIGLDDINIKKLRALAGVEEGAGEFFGLQKTLNESGKDLYFIDFIKQDVRFEEILHEKITENSTNPSVQKKYIWLYRYYISKFGKTEIPFENALGVLK